MITRKILSIVALSSLGLCLLCSVAKMAMKNPNTKQSCNHACSLLIIVAVVLVGVSQLLEEEKYTNHNSHTSVDGIQPMPLPQLCQNVKNVCYDLYGVSGVESPGEDPAKSSCCGEPSGCDSRCRTRCVASNGVTFDMYCDDDCEATPKCVQPTDKLSSSCYSQAIPSKEYCISLGGTPSNYL